MVYDAEWLAKIILGFYPEYNYYFDGRVGIKTEPHGVNILLDPKASAGIIMAALAKELNGGKVGEHFIYQKQNGEFSFGLTDVNCRYDSVLFVDAQKAIDILTQLAPQVLKNYFA